MVTCEWLLEVPCFITMSEEEQNTSSDGECESVDLPSMKDAEDFDEENSASEFTDTDEESEESSSDLSSEVSSAESCSELSSKELCAESSSNNPSRNSCSGNSSDDDNEQEDGELSAELSAYLRAHYKDVIVEENETENESEKRNLKKKAVNWKKVFEVCPVEVINEMMKGKCRKRKTVKMEQRKPKKTKLEEYLQLMNNELNAAQKVLNNLEEEIEVERARQEKNNHK